MLHTLFTLALHCLQFTLIHSLITTLHCTATVSARRHDGAGRGLVFFNNYVRNLTMSTHTGVSLSIALPDHSTMTVPDGTGTGPITVADGASFFWPIRLPLAGGALQLRYATAQPIASVGDGSAGAPTVLFFLLPAGTGPTAEFAFEDAALLNVQACAGSCSIDTTRNLLFAYGLPPSRGPALTVSVKATAATYTIVLLGEDDAARLWFGRLAGTRRAFLSAPGDSTLLRFAAPSDGAASALTLSTEAAGAPVALSIYPAPSRLSVGGNALPPQPDGGLFMRYSITSEPPVASVSVGLVRAASPPPPMTNGRLGYPDEPGVDGTLNGAAWASAGVWSIALSGATAPVPDGIDLRLRFNYTGDMARLYSVPPSVANASVTTLISDAYWNAPRSSAQLWSAPLTRPLGRALPLSPLTLRIIALRPDSPIWLDAWPSFGTGPAGSALLLSGVELLQTESIELEAAA